MADAERERLRTEHARWRRWGPYLAERAWGTVREDYSPTGDAWEYLPHDHARSRAFRWNEDGLAGISDIRQNLCIAFALWNGRDPFLKERIFGLSGPEGNHGEDAKEYWWFLDCTPTHSFMRWRYWYPQAEFPYERLLEENRSRGRDDPEFELVDTGVFDEDRYWDVEVAYAKATPDDICVRARVTNAGPEQDTLHVLPTLWFRNTWSWTIGAEKPSLRAAGGRILIDHPELGRGVLVADGAPDLLFCENESNARRLWNVDGPSFPKDGINDHVVHGAATVNPEKEGTKAALWHRLTVAPGATAEIRLRVSDRPDADLGPAFDVVLAQREDEADEFFASLAPDAGDEDRMILRQAMAGMLWSKQFYHYDVERWLDGDPGQPAPPEERKSGRNSAWRHLNNRDVLSMPDTWEYPWYAAWDLAFHTVALAHVDPEFAKHQLTLLCREWYMHPNGQLPAYEWNFGDVNPPVHAWAALRVFEIDGSTDHEFLERVMHKLLINFTWWVNRKDTEGSNVFEGGFLGLDNIGPFDRSTAVPLGGHLEQSDATAWMAMYCLNLLEMALVLANHDDTYEDLAVKFFEHFCYVASAMNEKGLWNEDDGFYEDVLHTADGRFESLHVRSMVGLIPLCATTTLGPDTMARLPEFAHRVQVFLENRSEFADVVSVDDLGNDRIARLLSIVTPERLARILEKMLSPDEFLSDHGLRALSKFHEQHPLQQDLGGGVIARVDYEPGESRSGLFGGNSNWRGPVWFPVNYLLWEALRRFHRYLRDDFAMEYPAGSGQKATLLEVSNDLARRLISLFTDDANGRRPVFGPYEKFQTDPAWHDVIPFHEYFHGDTGQGLGASHQTGWTGLVADLIIRLARNEGVD
jgi:hypothetical protein